MRTIRRLIVHHSAGPDTETAAQVRAYHTAAPPAGRGWSDIGYHWLIRRFSPSGVWTIEAGRPEDLVGAHDQGENTDSIGICIAGDYTRGPVPAEGWAILVAHLAGRCRAYHLPATAIEGHREHEPAATPTACPGFDPELLRQAVARELTA